MMFTVCCPVGYRARYLRDVLFLANANWHKTIEEAAYIDRYGILAFLWSKTLASPQTLNRAFSLATNMSKDIPNQSIVAEFQTAAECL